MAAVRVLGSVELVGASGQSDEATGLARAPRARRLLAALVIRANAVSSVDWLADCLWGQTQPSWSPGAVHNLVSRLRAALRSLGLSEVRLITRPPGYCLEMDRSALDAWQFEDLSQAGHRLLASDAEQAAMLLDEALASWRGPAYAEYADEDFARLSAIRLEELRITAEENRAEAELQLDRPVTAAARFSALSQLQPLRELPHARLMLAHYRAGQVAEALAVYRRYRDRLRDDLGLDPSPELAGLHAAVLRGDPALDPLRPASGAQTGRSRPPGGPTSKASPLSLVGRDHELRELSELLRVERLITLTGTGGVGKTSLAQAVAHHLGGGYRDGITVCDLTAVRAVESVAAALLTALQVPAEGRRDPRSGVLSFLADRELLLLLDNCEHVVSEIAGLVADVQATCPGVSVLATSRVALRIGGELVWPVAPLPVPDEGLVVPEEIARFESVQLFVLRASQRSNDWALTMGNAADVATLCRRLDGLPLAIELAAARISSLSPGELVERLDWRSDLLQDRGSLSDPRHRTLPALVGWSYDLLTPAEQELFDVLSVFAGPFTLADAEHIVAALPLGRRGPAVVARDIAALVEQSMIVVTHGETTHYRLLETLRDYGSNRLAERPYGAEVQHAHAAHFGSVAAATYGHLGGAEQVGDADRLEAAIGEFRQGYRWALDHDLELAATVVGSLNILVEQKLLAEVVSWSHTLIERFAACGRSPCHAARVYAIAASGALFVGDFDRTGEYLATAYALAGTDEVCTGYLRFIGACLAGARGDRSAAERMVEEEATSGRPDNAALLAYIDTNRLFVVTYRGDTEAAARQAHQLQVSAERQGWPVVAGWALFIRGEALADSSPAEAETLLAETLRRAREMDERLLSGVALVALASVRARHGDPHAAVGLFAQVVEHWRTRGNWAQQWTTLRNVVDLLHRLHRYEPTAVVAAGLETRGASAVGYGADSMRLAATWTRLAEVLDAQRLDELADQGRSMTDRELVGFVLDVLRSADIEPVGSTF